MFSFVCGLRARVALNGENASFRGANDRKCFELVESGSTHRHYPTCTYLYIRRRMIRDRTNAIVIKVINFLSNKNEKKNAFKKKKKIAVAFQKL